MSNYTTIIGSSNTDLIVKVPRLPKPGETVIGGTYTSAGGGKGANQAIAAARAGGSVRFIARVGADMYGDKALDTLRTAGVDTSYIIRDGSAPSGVALIMVDDSGENSIAVASGANARLSPADIAALAGVITGARVLLVQLEVPIETVEAAVRIASEAGVTVILNPAPAGSLPTSIPRHVAIITPNEHEAAALTGITVSDDTSAARAAEILQARGTSQVIITRGATGVYCSGTEYTGAVPAFSVEAVDTTAAGDVFNGVLAAELAGDRGFKEAVRRASAAAAISVTRLGAQPSAPDCAAIHAFLISRH